MDQPNILFIMSDQHRYDAVGAHARGTTAPLRTPALDRLIEQGADFTHAFTPIPICVPARSCLLSGQWSTQHGVAANYDAETFTPLPTDIPLAPRCVQQAGYHTIHVDRWHVTPHRTPHEYGFHDYVPNWRYTKWRERQGMAPFRRRHGWYGEADPVTTPDKSRLAWSADQAIDWIRRSQAESDPFFIRWQMVEPHPANCPPEPYASMYPPDELEPWAGFADPLDGKPYPQRQARLRMGIDDWTWDRWAPYVGRYLGDVTLLDEQIGRVLDTLDELGLAGNTLVIYTSDHGDMTGSHGLFDKHYVMYDDVVRVPLVMRWPGVIPGGRTVDAFVSNLVDMGPTWCDAAGADVPETFAGRSLLPLACGHDTETRPDIYAAYHGNQYGAYTQRMVRDRRWKYVWNATNVDELYDLGTDPGELHNRIADPACAAERHRLRHRLVAWMEQVGDRMLNPGNRTMLLEERMLGG